MRTMPDNSHDLKNPQLKASFPAVCSKAWVPSTLHIKRENTPTHTAASGTQWSELLKKKEVHSGQDSGGWNSDASGCVFSCTTWREKAQRGKTQDDFAALDCSLSNTLAACQGSKNQKRSRGELHHVSEGQTSRNLQPRCTWGKVEKAKEVKDELRWRAGDVCFC